MRTLRSSLLLMLVALVLMSTRGGSSMSFLHAAGAAAGAQEPDTDGDTMPDAWETFFGLDPNDRGGRHRRSRQRRPDERAGVRRRAASQRRAHAVLRRGLDRLLRHVGRRAQSERDRDGARRDRAAEQSGGVVSHRLTLGAARAPDASRSTRCSGTSAAVSIIVESDVPVAADRWMTWGTSGIGASLDSGAPAPATTWYFAEGATGPFLLYYLFENPGTSPANGDHPLSGRGRAADHHDAHAAAAEPDDGLRQRGRSGLAVASVGAVVTSTCRSSPNGRCT